MGLTFRSSCNTLEILVIFTLLIDENTGASFQDTGHTIAFRNLTEPASYEDNEEFRFRKGSCWSNKQLTTCPEGFLPQAGPWKYKPEEQCLRKDNCTCIKWANCEMEETRCIVCHPRCKEPYESRRHRRDVMPWLVLEYDLPGPILSREKRDCWTKNVLTTCPETYNVVPAPWRHPPENQCYKKGKCDTCNSFGLCKITYACCIECTPRCCRYSEDNCSEGWYYCKDQQPA